MLYDTDALCEMAAEKYYDIVYFHCFYRLHFDEEAAKDCTQEVFLIMTQKKKQLNLRKDMRRWLCKTADRVIRNYIRRETGRRAAVPLEETILSDDGGLAEVMTDSPLDCLTEKERGLLQAYYGAQHGTREALANEYGMTLPELYREIERLKKKLRSSM